ncbi:PAQR family membrane homeostasis protein TrhA [Shewanella algae]|uniref:PAQR family membrane homeostasis protein TrhA n=1 Tax=Shewanella algae TaxID=38313 RepID=UPI001AAC6DE9|nr:hemolysin III family protein [Shewanella algae]MBO2616134.1 hemolysin III family protein [Shewanella algae]
MPNSKAPAAEAQFNGQFSAGYSLNEEIANAVSHGLGVIAGILGLVLMLLKGWHSLDAIQLTGATIYGGSIILLFLCSTLYHSIPHPVWKRRLKMLDHCAIYLLIAGTYTPLMLITLADAQEEWVLMVIWSLALGGIVFKSCFIHRFKALSLVLYLAMGWLCVAVLPELIDNLSTAGFNLLLAGGLSYSLGVIFYATKAIPFNHAIWHLFVLGGAVCHFLCVYLTVI